MTPGTYHVHLYMIISIRHKGLKLYFEKKLSAIINGKQGISSDMALRLAKALNTTSEFWLHAQENYELAKARKIVNIEQVKVFGIQR